MNSKVKCCFLISWGLIILFCLGFGFYNRSTYWDPDFQQLTEDNIPVSFDDATEGDSFYQKYVQGGKDADISVNELLKSSDIVVKIRFDNQRDLERLSTFSTVIIDDVVKGDPSLSGKNIFVYEESFFLFHGKQSLFYLVNGNNLLRTGEQYILFLDHKEYPEQYVQSDKERLTFIMSQGTFSKYNITKNTLSKEQMDEANHPDGSIYFNQIKDIDFLLADPNLITAYLEVKEVILSKYRNE